MKTTTHTNTVCACRICTSITSIDVCVCAFVCANWTDENPHKVEKKKTATITLHRSFVSIPLIPYYANDSLTMRTKVTSSIFSHSIQTIAFQIVLQFRGRAQKSFILLSNKTVSADKWNFALQLAESNPKNCDFGHFYEFISNSNLLWNSFEFHRMPWRF